MCLSEVKCETFLYLESEYQKIKISASLNI